ncbi:cysteine--tRNA ligase [Candidatus Micrarchaeota archaeon]|nr:cysteine--tRNA ligase [Candidatus Micrarchaeota archaeon]
MPKFFNTLTRKKEAFKPLQNNLVRWYACGPTVYNYPHIGNYRAYAFVDLLRRFLEWKNYKVMLVMNITDVDDKTIRDSQKQGKTLEEFTRFYEKGFFEDLQTLNIKPANYYPRATDHINDMVSLIGELTLAHKAYQGSDGSWYYKISEFLDYGKLSGLQQKDLKAGASGRVAADEYTKDNVSDFVLWKAWQPDDGDVYWETRLGKGRPGWHIECSAMSTKYLGFSFDIHTGGVDLKFPHHENEIAQSEGASKKPFVKYWLHNEHLLVEGKKMSKSLGNFYTLRDLLDKNLKPAAIRYALIATHYRSQLNFTFDVVHAAEKTLDRLQDFLARAKEADGKNNPGLENAIKNTKKRFEDALDDDLDVAQALSAVFELEHQANKAMALGHVSKKQAERIADFFWNDFNAVFGVLEKKSATVPKTVLDLVEKREAARKKKDFKAADALRNQIKEKGFEVVDEATGPRLKKT